MKPPGVGHHENLADIAHIQRKNATPHALQLGVALSWPESIVLQTHMRYENFYAAGLTIDGDLIFDTVIQVCNLVSDCLA